MDNENYHFFCTGLSFESEEKAWESFYINCEEDFEWIKGVKAWRRESQFLKEIEFETGDIEYRVVARVLAFKELPKGWPEAKIRGPYDMSHMKIYEYRTV